MWFIIISYYHYKFCVKNLYYVYFLKKIERQKDEICSVILFGIIFYFLKSKILFVVILYYHYESNNFLVFHTITILYFTYFSKNWRCKTDTIGAKIIWYVYF